MKLPFFPRIFCSVSLIFLCVILCGVFVLPVFGQQQDNQPKRVQENAQTAQRALKRSAPHWFATPSVKAENVAVVLARPTLTTIDFNLLPSENGSGKIAFCEKGSNSKTETSLLSLQKNVAEVVTLCDLKANTEYEYQFLFQKSSTAAFVASESQTFRTPKSSGSSFSFMVQGDSHPERLHQNDPKFYSQTLQMAAAENPDFFIALGDDFSVDTIKPEQITKDIVESIYKNQRQFFGIVGKSSPLFLVNGNHEQAALCNLDGTPNNVAVCVQNAREKYFSQPAPNDFYSGNSEAVEHIGLLRNYFAWEWGDALFVAIDPYWHSKEAVDNIFGSRDKQGDAWKTTLGDAQYQWLKKTLEASKKPFKFVLSHHVNGRGRGGAECASLFEWGGKDMRGRNLFAEKRPHWEMPIHDLFVKNGVTIFFQGHDHIFVKQEKDGVIYQTLPLPADPKGVLYNDDAFAGDVKLSGSGVVKVTVSPKNVAVEYLKPTANGKSVAYKYEVKK